MGTSMGFTREKLGQTIPSSAGLPSGGVPNQRSSHGWLPSGKLTKKLWKITIFHGKTHYFYGHFQ
jgi:hypothetical protein